MRAGVISVILAATLATTVSAAKFSETDFNSTSLNYTWTGSNFNYTVGCASNCSYFFNITGQEAKNESIPAFSAVCNGTGGSAFQKCKITDDGDAARLVAAKLMSTNETMANGTGTVLAVSYEFIDPIMEATLWNYTGYLTLPLNQSASTSANQTTNFTITPTEIFGVS